jgi:hypothetical protein
MERTLKKMMMMYVCMYKGGPKTGPRTATFNDLSINDDYDDLSNILFHTKKESINSNFEF